MNKTSIVLGLSALVLGAAVIAPQAVLAYGPNYTEERHAAMEKAFETNDYNSWKALMNGRGRVTQVVNKDNFAKFANVHKLTEQGRIDEANTIKAELGLGLHNGMGMGMRMGR